MSDNTPPMLTVLRKLIDSHTDALRVGMPGVVVSYDAASMRASVQPAVQSGYRVHGERVVERLPVINEVPILWPSFMGGVRIKGTLVAGDPVWIVFSDLSLDRWKALGADKDPGDDRRHHMSDAVAYPGGMPSASDGDPQIEFTVGGEIHVGGSSGLVTRDEFNNHTHEVATTGTATAQTGTAAIPTPVAGTQVLKGA